MSVFYDNKHSTYLLPVKSDVRKKETMRLGETYDVQMEMIL